MEAANMSAEVLRQQISDTEARLRTLRDQLASIEENESTAAAPRPQPCAPAEETISNSKETKWPLTPEEYSRYGRQMIVPRIGIQGQLRLKAASVLIIGAGGLGCPAALYIAGAGVGTLGLVDGDTVETSNLHRQVLHNTDTVDMWKVDSATQFLKKFNPNVRYNVYRDHLSPENALGIVSQYDIVLDCTDHPKPRYLISDVCTLLSKPLVSASALKTDGQLMVLNYPPRPAGDPTGGPCYRCVFPRPPPANQLVSCADGGIVGPVVGVMGVLQALEAIKMITAGISVEDTTLSESDSLSPRQPPSMLIFASNSPSPFRTIRLRSRRPDCFACSAKAELTQESMQSGTLDYVAFCGEAVPVRILSAEERISANEYAHIKDAGKIEHLLLDVREKVQFDICNIEGSINIPFSMFQGGQVSDPGDAVLPSWLPSSLPLNAPIYVVCRLGNDSQVVTRKLRESGLDSNGSRFIGDIEGGFKSWKSQVDPGWPEY